MRLRLLLLALTASTGVIGLGQSFRSDEIWSLHTVALPFGSMMAQLRSDVHPPLYYLLLRLWVPLAGATEAGSRALSLLLHMAAGATVFLTAQRRLGPERAAVCAAVLLASPLGSVAAQLVRMYTLLELTAALSILFWLRFVEEDRLSWRWWAAFVAANIAGSFTHIWFFFLLAAVAVVHLARWRTHRLGWMTLAAVPSLAPYGALWLPVLLAQAGRTADNLAWLKPPEWSAPIEVALMQGGAAAVVAAVGLVFRRKETSVDATPWLLWLLALGIPFAISFLQPVFWPRFTVVALPALALALGTWISGRISSRTALAAVVLPSILLTLVLAATRSDECDARWTARWLTTNVGSDDLVIFTNLSRLPVEHYLRPQSRVVASSIPAAIDAHPGYEGRIDPVSLDAEIQALTTRLSGSRAGSKLVLFHGFDPPTHARLTQALDQRFRRETELCHKCESMLNYYREITVWRTQ
ncbi:MAG: glycosyltransferase family 39 protein [Bryobacteraceae bacterium]|nr:glycosyltransferase family 39 protein [Bryobacteraceae bacterium]